MLEYNFDKMFSHPQVQTEHDIDSIDYTWAMNKKPCCLGLHRGIYQFKGSLINNQDSMESKAVFFSWLTSFNSSQEHRSRRGSPSTRAKRPSKHPGDLCSGSTAGGYGRFFFLLGIKRRKWGFKKGSTRSPNILDTVDTFFWFRQTLFFFLLLIDFYCFFWMALHL